MPRQLGLFSPWKGKLREVHIYIYIKYIFESKLTEKGIGKLSDLDLKTYTLRLEKRGIFSTVRRIKDLCLIVGSIKG